MEDIQRIINEFDADILAKIGDIELAWSVDEYPRQTRSKRWYIITGVLGMACLLYAVFTANFLFSIIILMGGVIMLITGLKEPRQIPVIITNIGLVVGDIYYDYKDLKDFSILYQPPDFSLLSLRFNAWSQPLLSIPIEDQDPLAIRNLLLPYCLENLERTDEDLTDLLRRVYKL